MTDPTDPNLRAYNSPEVTAYYSALNYLTPCERLLFDTYLRPGVAILDLGVGGGRTTPYLSSIAKRYVGVDYAPAMIAACRKKFPAIEFEVANATDLSLFATASFDAVVMAFNGFDYMASDESRRRALREIGRVLRPEGIFAFSSHNPRSILVRAGWNSQRLANVAKKIAGADSILHRPLMVALTAARALLAAMQAGAKSLGRIGRRVPTATFWRGEGYLTDPVHGGLRTHLATPERVKRELSGFGFRLLRVLGDDYPQVSHAYITDWYYYVFSKAEAPGEK
jgi:SAM-dependent methyltransferase